MANLLDYLSWRGDLPLSRDPFNEVDAAVLARFAYLPFETFPYLSPEDVRTVRSLAPYAQAGDAFRKPEDSRLLSALSGSERFGPLNTGFFEARWDERVQTQFFAVTVMLDESRAFIAFRGTDNTLVGWKEDMNMSFLCPIPGQEMAADYVRRAAARTGGRLILGGHSKGGNLALYAAAFCGEAAQKRIDAVYNFDGPGFFDNVLKTDGYRKISSRFHTFIPQFSVVGMLLGRKEQQTVVHSFETGLSQHDIYSWEVLGPRFAYLPAVTGGSRFLDSTLKDWIADMTPEQFEGFADAIYSILSDTNVRTLREMRENWLDSAISILRSFSGLDERTRNAVTAALRLLMQSAGDEIKAAIEGQERTYHSDSP